MKKTTVFFITAIFILIFSNSYAFESTELRRIDLIEVNVLSRQIVFSQNAEGKSLTFPAATAKKEKEDELPYEKIGEIWQIAFNPPWTPTDSIREESIAKGKVLPQIILPGAQDNPLGRIKLFIGYNGCNSTLGIHGTNEPHSIGKRATHSCNRMYLKDISAVTWIILLQNGYSDEEVESLFLRAKENPRKTIYIKLYDKPAVIYHRS
jgi:hypothetical protein